MSESINELGCRFEYRDATIHKHFAANNVPVETVIAVFQQFNRGDESFRKAIRWRNISKQFDWSSPENEKSDEVKEIVAVINNVYAAHESNTKGKSAMRHFVGYHSTATMGRDLDVQPGDPEIAFLSNKAYGYLENARGNKVWMISGTKDGAKTIYRLHGYYDVEDIEEGSDGFDWRVYGLEPKFLEAPVVVSDFEWFLRLKKEQNNFSLGMNEIRDQEVITALQNSMKIKAKVPQPAKKLTQKVSSRRKN